MNHLVKYNLILFLIVHLLSFQVLKTYTCPLSILHINLNLCAEHQNKITELCSYPVARSLKHSYTYS